MVISVMGLRFVACGSRGLSPSRTPNSWRAVVPAVRVFDLPSLLAGKIHALLCRRYTKGRDWYDFIWYAARKTAINHDLLSSAVNQVGPWAGQRVVTNDAWCGRALASAIERLDIAKAREDVRRFMRPEEVRLLDLCRAEFFQSQNRRLTGYSG